MKYIRKKSRLRPLFGLLIILLAIIMLLVFVDSKLRPLLKIAAESRATSMSTKIINDTIAHELTQYDMSYDQLVEIDRNEDGTVSAIRTNVVKLNKFKADVSSAVLEALGHYTQEEIKIPIGTAIGGDLFTGRGPALNMKLVIANGMESDITNSFEESGINQTKHQIMMHIGVDVSAVLAWFSVPCVVETNFILAETVIVGTVPDAYTYVGRSNNIADDIADYGAH